MARAILAICHDEATPMALLLDIEAPLFATTLAGLKAGKIGVPLSLALPSARLATILEDAQASLIVTHTRHLSLAHSLAQHAEHVLNIDTLDTNLGAENLGLSLLPDTLAWIFYTSGSTGKPKGILQNHRNILRSFGSWINTLHIGAADHLTFLYPV